MINRALFLRELRGSVKTLIVFGSITLLYIVIIVDMYDPKLAASLDDFVKAMPDLMAAFGMKQGATSLISFLDSYLYGFVLLLFPMVFSILRANGLIARYVDRGSMVSLIAAPVKRSTVAFTQLCVLIADIIILLALSTVTEIISAAILFPGELNTSGLLILNAGLLALQLFIAGICFFCSCLFSDARFSMGFGAGIPSLMYVLKMLADASSGAEDIKYFTFLTLFNPDGLIHSESGAIISATILFASAIALFAGSVVVFTKKDLSI
jgi:ABC-2 type transport system permease protein